MVLLYLLLVLLTHSPTQMVFVISHCYFGVAPMFSLTFCGLTYSFGLPGGKNLVLLILLIFIWTTLYIVFFFLFSQDF